MAKIEIEKKPRRPLWPVLLAIVVVALVAFGAWYYMRGRPVAAPGQPTPGASGSAETPPPPAEVVVPVAGGERMVQA